MSYLYFIALIPVVIGGILWVFNKEVHWKEWIIGAVASFVVAATFHIVSLGSNEMVDYETWNGQVTKTTFYPEWVEEYEEAVYRTETYSCGTSKSPRTCTRQVFSHYETRYRTHREYWEVNTNIGETKNISMADHKEIGKRFGGNLITKKGNKSGFYKGDPNIYHYTNETQAVVPFSVTKKWKNNLKGAATVYDFPEVPETLVSALYDWPEVNGLGASNRLLGIGNDIDIQEWDKMNAVLGPLRQCNVIMIGFGAKFDSSIAEWQRSKWIGGNKNDIVLCYGIDANGKVAWSKSFGWSQNEIVFAQLDTILLNNPINNDIIPLIRDAIRKDYQRKEWSDFDYIKAKPPIWVYTVYPVVTLLIQIGLYFWFAMNDNSSLPGERRRIYYVRNNRRWY